MWELVAFISVEKDFYQNPPHLVSPFVTVKRTEDELWSQCLLFKATVEASWCNVTVKKTWWECEELALRWWKHGWQVIMFFVVEGPLKKENGHDVILLETMRVLCGDASMQSERRTFEQSCNKFFFFAWFCFSCKHFLVLSRYALYCL